MPSTPATRSRVGRAAVAALVFGIASAALMTVVAFIALVLAAAAIVLGGIALGRGENRSASLAGILLALGAVALFVVEVSG